MTIRTYFWHDRVISSAQFQLRKLLKKSPYFYFKIGNSGDIFTQLIIENHYHQQAKNIKNKGRRLLLVGSIGHNVQDGDLICGIGTKSKDIPKNQYNNSVVGLRGPLSYEAFKLANYDVSQVKFLKDPGLLLRFYAEDIKYETPNGYAFIPHYRERNLYIKAMPKGMRYIDIDNTPLAIAKQILEAEIIYSSSLHGIIFAHALNRPAILVKPKTEEPRFKYQDYFASIDQPMPSFLDDIYNIKATTKPLSPLNLTYRKQEFAFPDITELKTLGIAS